MICKEVPSDELLRGREADLRGLDQIEVTRVVLGQLWVVT
jgi:hypothetical protein